MFHPFLPLPAISIDSIVLMNRATPFHNKLSKNTHALLTPPRDTDKFSNFYIPFNNINYLLHYSILC